MTHHAGPGDTPTRLMKEKSGFRSDAGSLWVATSSRKMINAPLRIQPPNNLLTEPALASNSCCITTHESEHCSSPSQNECNAPNLAVTPLQPTWVT